MSEAEILNTIKSSKGISYGQLVGLFPEDPTIILDDHLQALINSGFIILFQKVYYPISRSIGLIPKSQNKTVEEIEIEDISVTKIRTLFTPNENDPLFFEGYLIDEKRSKLFTEMNIVKFDFSKFDYYLLCQFDNS